MCGALVAEAELATGFQIEAVSDPASKPSSCVDAYSGALEGGCGAMVQAGKCHMQASHMLGQCKVRVCVLGSRVHAGLCHRQVSLMLGQCKMRSCVLGPRVHAGLCRMQASCMLGHCR